MEVFHEASCKSNLKAKTSRKYIVLDSHVRGSCLPLKIISSQSVKFPLHAQCFHFNALHLFTNLFCVRMGMHMEKATCKFGSSLLPVVLWGSSSGGQDWPQAPELTEPSPPPLITFT